MDWQRIDEKARGGKWILAWYGDELSDLKSSFAVVRAHDGEWWNDEGDRVMAEPDMWMPLPAEPSP